MNIARFAFPIHAVSIPSPCHLHGICGLLGAPTKEWTCLAKESVTCPPPTNPSHLVSVSCSLVDFLLRRHCLAACSNITNAGYQWKILPNRSAKHAEASHHGNCTFPCSQTGSMRATDRVCVQRMVAVLRQTGRPAKASSSTGPSFIRSLPQRGETLARASTGGEKNPLPCPSCACPLGPLTPGGPRGPPDGSSGSSFVRLGRRLLL
ncbi:hypothetical protein IWZ01DRAFT_297334 [Phyllosticta capitalensis]